MSKLKPCPYCAGTGFRRSSFEAGDLRFACEIVGIYVGPDDTVSRKAAARLLHKSILTLRNWALAGTGPDYIKSGRYYRYSLEAIGKYMDRKNKFGP